MASNYTSWVNNGQNFLELLETDMESMSKHTKKILPVKIN